MPFRSAKASEIEIVKMVRGDTSDTWTVLLSFRSGGEEVMVTLDIQEGKIVSAAEDVGAPEVKD